MIFINETRWWWWHAPYLFIYEIKYSTTFFKFFASSSHLDFSYLCFIVYELVTIQALRLWDFYLFSYPLARFSDYLLFLVSYFYPLFEIIECTELATEVNEKGKKRFIFSVGVEKTPTAVVTNADTRHAKFC